MAQKCPCLLRTIKGKLLSKEFLKNQSIIDSDLCVLCKQSPETLEHLFLELSALFLDFVQIEARYCWITCCKPTGRSKIVIR